ncbi:acyl-CoA dehydrogenase family protein [Saccharopolyspora mangrovi]|uniref:Acyl-CoA dehydrogenase family protein n=1 Tax=Saccharopolyspora mangrovi TaxID=3082379 RepID=A0ABU6A577_9PSEU|nr:acyl-CoA dehydrogenase family protein [Saccharopolyspora sp. S2-29]MEB3366727.1 acyl-CoA dehydrogenase family protein [Saccharopolyspora sp. S2-29]
MTATVRAGYVVRAPVGEEWSMPSLMPPPVREDAALISLRREVRSFLAEQVEAGAFAPTVDSWLSGWDVEFTRALAQRGWLGMTVPVEHGGHGRTFLERFVVTEELLAAGAPVAAHWIADRQVAPNLLRFGSDALKGEYLPRIVAGEVFFAIGMSEPDSGSDLASVRTRAERVDGGWRVRGTKLWTSGAHLADAFIALVRTSPQSEDRHGGLSQLLVLLDSPGVQVRPVLSANGTHHFNEVHLDGVHVPDEHVVGEIGAGWHQVTSELSFERSGPERFLSTYQLAKSLVGSLDPAEAGRISARLAGLHQMSLSVAAALQNSERPDVPAALVKVLGTTLEGDIAELADLDTPAGASGGVAALTRRAVQQRPGFTLRGGTNEVLRGVIARGLGMR